MLWVVDVVDSTHLVRSAYIPLHDLYDSCMFMYELDGRLLLLVNGLRGVAGHSPRDASPTCHLVSEGLGLG